MGHDTQPPSPSLASEVGEFFETWASAGGVGLVVTDPNGVIEFANRECEELCGLVAGANILDAFDTDELARVAPLLGDLNATGASVDTTAHLRGSAAIARFLMTRTTDAQGRTRAIVGAFRDVTSQGLHERHLEYAANHDDLTGVLSRAAAMRELEERFGSDTGAGSTAVLYIDLDGFKGINDGYGHLVGDEILKSAAARIRGAVDSNHSVARIGGDEFLVVLDIDTTDSAVSIAHDVAEALSPPIEVDDLVLSQRFSIGVATTESSGDEQLTARRGVPLPDRTPARMQAERLLIEADMAMYVAKHDENPVALADESTRTWSTRRLVIERDLPGALERDEIKFHYQPLVDLRTRKWVAAEALMRWHHPELGLLPPELVIERAEVIGCIDDLTSYTLDTVTREWAQVVVRAPVMFHHQVTLNASHRQLSWEGFADVSLAAIERAGLTPEHLVVEVTESSQIELHTSAAATLNRLADEGIAISLDDFGVGYTALAYFTQFPIHVLKVDRSLVSELRGDASITERLLRGVVQLAKDLGTQLIGEGIESEQSAQFCQLLGMPVGQGHHLGLAMPFEEFCVLAVENGMPQTSTGAVRPAGAIKLDPDHPLRTPDTPDIILD